MKRAWWLFKPSISTYIQNISMDVKSRTWYFWWAECILEFLMNRVWSLSTIIKHNRWLHRGDQLFLNLWSLYRHQTFPIRSSRFRHLGFLPWLILINLKLKPWSNLTLTHCWVDTLRITIRHLSLSNRYMLWSSWTGITLLYQLLTVSCSWTPTMKQSLK